MDKNIWGMLNDSEQELLRAVEPAALVGLDEDDLVELHDRVRRARNKYSKLYRRRGAAQVADDRARAKAHAQHARTAAKAEAFEEALARVSRSLAKAAKASADELKAERIAAAKSVKSSGPKTKPRAVPSKNATKKKAPAAKRAKAKSPVSKRAVAGQRATKARSQAKRDSR